MKNISTIISSSSSYLIVLFFILIIWSFVFITSGSLFSGYHLTDDHTIVEINYNLINQNLNIIKVLTQWIKIEHVNVNNPSQVKYRSPSFDTFKPCAIISVGSMEDEEINFKETNYSRVWQSSRIIRPSICIYESINNKQ
jgi:hypothetical protein